jgi:hypothetical protein
MPKRVIDFDAMWGSDKLASCAAWAQAEYAWLYGLADASGCFELTNLRVIWGRVAAIRGNLTTDRLEQVFAEFQDKGLLFVWQHEGKRYAHWTGSDVPGRLPPPSWRMRLEKFAPPVPKQQLAEYMARFARGRAAMGCAGFREEQQQEPFCRNGDLKYENPDLRETQGLTGCARSSQLTEQRQLVTDREADRQSQGSNIRANRNFAELPGTSRLGELYARSPESGQLGEGDERPNVVAGSALKERLEGAQGQDLGLDWNLSGNHEMGRSEKRSGPGDGKACSGNANRETSSVKTDFDHSNSKPSAKAQEMSPKDLAVARELRVGQGPVCGPARVKPEVLERIRQREAARAGSKSR